MSKRKVYGANSQERIIWAGLFVPSPTGRIGLPYLLEGPPGGGKTSAIRRITKMAGLHFEGVASSLREPTDFIGMPVPQRMQLTKDNAHLSPDMDESIMVMNYAPAGFAIRAAERRESLIFLDEVNTAPPAVQASLLRLLFEGVCGELELPRETRFLLAMNATQDAAGGWQLAAPLANRMGHLKWEAPAVESFTSYLMGGGASIPVHREVDPVLEAAAVRNAWSDAWAMAAGVIGGFLHARPNLLLKMPPSGSPEASKAWASPRTWDFATTAYAASIIYDLTDEEAQDSIRAFVGTGPATELYSWRRNADLPDPRQLLTKQIKFAHNPARLDRTAAVLTACTAMVLSEKDPAAKTSMAGALWGIHGDIMVTAPDIAMGSVVQLCQQKLMIGNPDAYKVLAKMEPVLSAAGIVPEQP